VRLFLFHYATGERFNTGSLKSIMGFNTSFTIQWGFRHRVRRVAGAPDELAAAERGGVGVRVPGARSTRGSHCHRALRGRAGGRAAGGCRTTARQGTTHHTQQLRLRIVALGLARAARWYQRRWGAVGVLLGGVATQQVKGETSCDLLTTPRAADYKPKIESGFSLWPPLHAVSVLLHTCVRFQLTVPGGVGVCGLHSRVCSTATRSERTWHSV
jgi:hypothetical protein